MDEERSRKRKGSGLTMTEREERNIELIRDRLRGQSWTYLASKYSIEPSRCKTIFERWRKQNPGTYQGRDPLAIVHSMLDRLEAWTEQLADVADSAPTHSVEIAAINAQLQVLTRTAELLQATGLLPHDLGTLRIEMDVQALAVRLVQVLTEQGATPEMKRAILDTLKHDARDAMQQPQLQNGQG